MCAIISSYMNVRYEGDKSGKPDLMLTDALTLIHSTTNLMGSLRTLLAWHLADPVVDRERQRNDVIHDLYQRNRNPFVDHPEWVWLVFEAALPRLAVRAENGRLRLSWDTVFTNAVLEATSSAGLPWARVLVVPIHGNGQWIVMQPVIQTMQFFRLKVE